MDVIRKKEGPVNCTDCVDMVHAGQRERKGGKKRRSPAEFVGGSYILAPPDP